MLIGERLANDDETALAECYTALSPLVRRHIAGLVPRHAVDDVVQAVFLDVWRCRHRYDTARAFEPWVLAIARKRAIDKLRAEARHYRRSAPLDDVTTAGGPTTDSTGAVDAACDVRRALAALPPPQRQALVLAHFGQLTQREIADRLAIPLGTVKARTTRGLRRMRELL